MRKDKSMALVNLPIIRPGSLTEPSIPKIRPSCLNDKNVVL